MRRHLFCLPLLLLAADVRAQVQQAIAPPTERTVREIVAVIESGDPSARGALIARALSLRARAADSARIDRFLADLHDQGAPFSLVSMEPAGRNMFARVASARTGRTATLQVATDRSDPTGIGVIDILEAHPSVLDSLTWPHASGMSAPDIASTLAANLGRLEAAGALSGVVYVARGDSMIYGRGFGLADREDSIRNTLRTRFAMASMGKMFTATAILQLVERGQLRLDDTLVNVLPRYPNADRARRITIRHLLEHTAGMGDQWRTARKPVPGLTGSLAVVGAVAHAPLLFEPGTRWSYSNEGYNVLAAVIEELSGATFKEFIRREILAPAGMVETVLEGGSDDIIPRRAVGYRPRANDPLGALEPRANWSFINGATAGGAGGGYTTAVDLARFARALRNGTLLGAALRDSMWTGRWPIPGHGAERYGLGSFVREIGGVRVVGHGGGGTGSGIDTGFRHFTDGSWTVVVLTNIDPPTATTLTAAIVAMLATAPRS